MDRIRSRSRADRLPPEDDLVRALTRGLPQSWRTVTGPGSDCAAVRLPGRAGHLLLKADAVVEGVHFTAGMPAEAVGWKAMCRAVSDIAAAGGIPREALISLAMPPETSWTWLRGVYRGLVRAVRRFDAGIAGGETASAPPGSPVAISVFLTGEASAGRVFSRAGGRQGDALCVTGRLGGSFASGRHLTFVPRIAESRWLAERFPPTAMMDLSDGLARDLPRLADASGTGWQLDDRAIPRHRGSDLAAALTDGEDYELLFAQPAARWTALDAAWRRAFPRTKLTRIGTLTPPDERSPLPYGGWDHFPPGR